MALRQWCVRLPVTHAPNEGGDATPIVVAHVTLQLTMFSDQCMWVHVMNDCAPSVGKQQRRGLPVVGCAAMAAPTAFPPYVSESILLESPSVQPELQQDGEVVGTSATAPQTAFARSLAVKLTRRYKQTQPQPQQCHGDTSKGILFTVCCGISGPLEASLIGNIVGSPSPSVLAFGGLVFREVVALVDNALNVAAAPA